MYQDKTLACQECSQEFIFSADDQQYHADKGYTNEPKRCKPCRQARRAAQSGNSYGGGYSGGGNSYGGGYSGGGYSGGGRREMHPATCAQCGKETEVPFLPRGDRPVYCSDCFRQQPSYRRGGRVQSTRTY